MTMLPAASFNESAIRPRKRARRTLPIANLFDVARVEKAAVVTGETATRNEPDAPIESLTRTQRAAIEAMAMGYLYRFTFGYARRGEGKKPIGNQFTVTTVHSLLDRERDIARIGQGADARPFIFLTGRGVWYARTIIRRRAEVGRVRAEE